MLHLRRSRLLISALVAFGVVLTGSLLLRVDRLLADSIFSPPDAEDLWPDTETWAEEQLQAMTLEERVAQLFSVRAYGQWPAPDDAAHRELIDLVERFGLGGVTFFQGNPADQIALVKDLQARAKFPLLIAQAMEWGAGMRVEETTVFPRAMAIGATGDVAWAHKAGYATGQEARALGVGHVLAPVADVNNNPDNPVINTRSFGEQPKQVAAMATAFAKGLQEAGVLATAKHFPGHGDTAVDSHLALPVLPFSADRLEALELVPFRKLIGEGVMSVMVGHLALPQIEPDSSVPASLSPRISSTLLRDELDFDGLVVTDALDMAGVTDQFPAGEIAVRALLAGADVLLLSEDPWAARDAVLQAVAEGSITEDHINAAVMRILQAKAWLGLPEDRRLGADGNSLPITTPEHQELSRNIAQRSLTLLRNADGILPLAKGGRILCITLTDQANPAVGSHFITDLRQNLPDNDVEVLHLDQRSSPEDYERALAQRDEYAAIAVSAFLRARPQNQGAGTPQDLSRRFLDQLVEDGPPVALVSFGDPYSVRDMAQPAAYLVTYSAAEVSQKAAAAALAGHAEISGRLPVTIPGAYGIGEGLDLRGQSVHQD